MDRLTIGVCQLIISLSNIFHYISYTLVSTPQISCSHDNLITLQDSYFGHGLCHKVSIDVRAVFATIIVSIFFTYETEFVLFLAVLENSVLHMG